MLVMSVYIALILLYGYLVPRTDSAFWRALLAILTLPCLFGSVGAAGCLMARSYPTHG